MHRTPIQNAALKKIGRFIAVCLPYLDQQRIPSGVQEQGHGIGVGFCVTVLCAGVHGFSVKQDFKAAITANLEGDFLLNWTVNVGEGVARFGFPYFFRLTTWTNPSHRRIESTKPSGLLEIGFHATFPPSTISVRSVFPIVGEIAASPITSASTACPNPIRGCSNGPATNHAGMNPSSVKPKETLSGSDVSGITASFGSILPAPNSKPGPTGINGARLDHFCSYPFIPLMANPLIKYR